MNGVDTGTSGYNINFIDGLNEDKTAGDINTIASTSSTVGLDCSGFISAAYDFGTKYNTSNLNLVFKNTNWNNIDQGDIGNISNHHTWMFISFIRDSNDNVTGVYTYEATTDGDQDRAKFWERAWDNAETYTPMEIK